MDLSNGLVDMPIIPDHSGVPGTVIDYSPASLGRYIGSPSIALAANGDYFASHDFFGPGTDNNEMAVFKSEDRGETWEKISTIFGQWWSTIFFHEEELYLLGTSREFGSPVIRRSVDGGVNWSTPQDSKSGLLSPEDKYHCAPVPVMSHDGYLWRAFELAYGPRSDWLVQVLSVPHGSDILNSDSWRFSSPLSHSGQASEWIEGNIVVAPTGELKNILRRNLIGVSPELFKLESDKAIMVNIDYEGKSLTHNIETDILNFPGGGVKFTIRYDDQSGMYWALVCKQKNPDAYRNNLVMGSSEDLINWEIKQSILHHHDMNTHAFQYVDWQFEGADIVFVSRTSFEDGLGGAHDAHDANYMTFHRVLDFRG